MVDQANICVLHVDDEPDFAESHPAQHRNRTSRLPSLVAGGGASDSLARADSRSPSATARRHAPPPSHL
jgi:hypothetical protein